MVAAARKVDASTLECHASRLAQVTELTKTMLTCLIDEENLESAVFVEQGA